MNLFKKFNSALIVIVLLFTFSLPVYADLFADEIYEGTGTYKVDDVDGKIEFVNEWSVSVTGNNEKYIATSGTRDVKLTFSVEGVPEGKSYRVEPFVYFNDCKMQAWAPDEWERFGVEDTAFTVDGDGEYSVVYSTGKLIDHFSIQEYKTVVNISDIGFQFAEYDKGLIVKFVSIEDIVGDTDTETTTTAQEKATTTADAKKDNTDNADNGEQISNGTKLSLYIIVAAAVIIVVAIAIIVISKRRKRFY